MPDSYGRRVSALGGMVLAIPLTLGAFGLGAGAMAWMAGAFGLTPDRQAISEAQCAKVNNCGPDNDPLQVRETKAAEGAFAAALFQGFLGVLGLVGVGVTVRYAHRAWEESAAAARSAAEANKISADALMADQRAWIKLRDAWVTIEPPGIVWSPEGGKIAFTVQTQNVGKTPAIGLFTLLDLHIDITVLPDKRRDEMVEQISTAPARIGALVFASDPYDQKHTLTITPEKMEAARDALDASVGAAAGPVPLILSTYLIGVVSYFPLPSMERRYTSFVLHLSESGPIPVAIKANEDRAPHQLRLARWPMGDIMAT